MRRQLSATKRANKVTQHDIKLELDVRSQALIEKTLRRAFPQVAILGEEGVVGDEDAEFRWVVDPIDGTVNFAYGIPHACVSIALQRRAPSARTAAYHDGYDTLLGVIYDPFCDELWTAIRGQPARLNGKIIRVSRRRKLSEAIVSIGPRVDICSHGPVRRLHRARYPALGHRGWRSNRPMCGRRVLAAPDSGQARLPDGSHERPAPAQPTRAGLSSPARAAPSGSSAAVPLPALKPSLQLGQGPGAVAQPVLNLLGQLPSHHCTLSNRSILTK